MLDEIYKTFSNFFTSFLGLLEHGFKNISNYLIIKLGTVFIAWGNSMGSYGILGPVILVISAGGSMLILYVILIAERGAMDMEGQ